MGSFTYQAADPCGHIVRGSIDADNNVALDSALKARGLYLLSFEVNDERSAASSNPRFIARFTRVLAGLLSSGLPLTRALASIARTAKPTDAAVLNDIRKRLEKGDTFGQALEHQAEFFPPLFRGVVRAGERSGTLAPALERLALHTEAEMEIRQKITSAAVYPILLFVSGSASVFLLLFWILPRFATLLSDAGAALPWSTTVMLGISAGLQSMLPLAGPLAIVLIGAVAWITTTDSGRQFMFSLLSRIPWIGPMRRASVGARFARLLSVLLKGGAPVLAATQITARSFRDVAVQQGILSIHERLREGERLSTAMTASGLFPEVLLELGRFGEEAARLPEFLERAAEIMEIEGQETMRRITVLAEPLMIVFFGVIVGFVALSLLQAVYGLNANALR